MSYLVLAYVSGTPRITFHSHVSLVSSPYLGLSSVDGFARAEDYISFDCFFSISRTLRTTFHSLILLVSFPDLFR